MYVLAYADCRIELSCHRQPSANTRRLTGENGRVAMLRDMDRSPRLEPGLAEREFATEQRMLDRRLDRWATVEGYDPASAVMNAVRAVGGGDVLEVGPGAGELAERLIDELGCVVRAVDISPRLVELVRARGIDAVVGDVQELPFAASSFDVVVAQWVLHFVPEIDRALGEIARVLRPGGRFVAARSAADHLAEVWSLVRRPAAHWDLDCESAEATLRRHFASVERRPIDGTVLFPDARSLRGYVKAFEVIDSRDLSSRVTAGTASFRATARGCILVADLGHTARAQPQAAR